MNIHLAPVHSIDDSINGGRLQALLSINGEEPPHAAVGTVCEAHVAVERHPQSCVGAGLTEIPPTGEGVEGTAIPRPLGDGSGDGTVFPVGVVGGVTHVTVFSCGERGRKEVDKGVQEREVVEERE